MNKCHCASGLQWVELVDAKTMETPLWLHFRTTETTALVWLAAVVCSVLFLGNTTLESYDLGFGPGLPELSSIPTFFVPFSWGDVSNLRCQGRSRASSRFGDVQPFRLGTASSSRPLIGGGRRLWGSTIFQNRAGW